jgi:hypothetical protein
MVNTQAFLQPTQNRCFNFPAIRYTFRHYHVPEEAVFTLATTPSLCLTGRSPQSAGAALLFAHSRIAAISSAPVTL